MARSARASNLAVLVALGAMVWGVRTGGAAEDAGQARAAQRERVVYRAQHVPAGDIALAVSEFMRRDKAGMGRQLKDIARPEPPRVEIVAEAVSNSVLVSAPASELEEVLKLIESLDEAPSSVVVRLVIAEMVSEEPEENRTGAAVGASPQSVLLRALREPSLTGTRNDGEPGVVIKGAGQELDRVLQDLEKRGRVEIISRPEIMTLNNQLATLKTTSQVTLWSENQGGSTTARSARMQEVGLSLTVTPRISRSGVVAMEVNVERAVARPSDEQAKWIDTKSLRTVVELEEGQVAVLGGLVTRGAEGRRELLVLAMPSIITPGERKR